MKRTPLKRKTPLKRSGRLRPVSKKRAALKRLMDPKRTAFVLATEYCMICKVCLPTDCHEICRGPAREASLSRPELWLAVCRTCHDYLDDTAFWTIDKQLAERFQYDIRKAVKSANEVTGKCVASVLEITTRL